MRGSCGRRGGIGVNGVSEGELLLEDVCPVFEKKSRREAVLEICENEGWEAGGADFLVD